MNRNFIIEASKYFIVGGFCAIIDFSLLYFLATSAGVNYVLASIISFVVGAVLNYFLCIGWIFKTRTISNRYLEFILYIVITTIGLGLNTIFIWCLTEFMHFHFMLSKVFATGITFIWNFSARKYFLHTKHQSSKSCCLD